MGYVGVWVGGMWGQRFQKRINKIHGRFIRNLEAKKGIVSKDPRSLCDLLGTEFEGQTLSEIFGTP